MSAERMNPGEIHALQETRFQSVWSHIVATPLHRRKLQQAGIEARSVRSLADLGRLPFTYKEDARTAGLMERTPLTMEQISAAYSSGGSSGSPTLYAWSEQDVEVHAEVARRIVAGVGTTSSDLGLVLAPLSLLVMGHCMVRQFSAVGAGVVPVGAAEPDLVASLLTELPARVIATLPSVASRLLDYMRFVMHLDLKDRIQVRQRYLRGGFLTANCAYRRATLLRLGGSTVGLAIMLRISTSTGGRLRRAPGFAICPALW